MSGPILADWETRIIEDPTTDEILAWAPREHPDFVECDVEFKWTFHPVVYVPSLVYMLNRLGGPANVAALKGEPLVVSVLYVGHGHRRAVAEVSAWHPGNDGSLFLEVSDWHAKESCLSVFFSVPAKWHLGEWEVAHVLCEDLPCSTPELARDVALLCDRIIGKRLADDY